MKIAYRPHFKFRANQRKIDLDLTKRVYLRADNKFFDSLRKHHICLKKVKKEGQSVTLMLAYDKIGSTIEFITIHKIREKEIKNKVKSGRWIHED